MFPPEMANKFIPLVTSEPIMVLFPENKTIPLALAVTIISSPGAERICPLVLIMSLNDCFTTGALANSTFHACSFR